MTRAHRVEYDRIPAAPQEFRVEAAVPIEGPSALEPPRSVLRRKIRH
ncbi:hypothetical protein [Streptomyces sp. TP-A0356]|nr:hypothetical protein [Streptomyces sp. TP-A0356]